MHHGVNKTRSHRYITSRRGGKQTRSDRHNTSRRGKRKLGTHSTTRRVFSRVGGTTNAPIRETERERTAVRTLGHIRLRRPIAAYSLPSTACRCVFSIDPISFRDSFFLSQSTVPAVLLVDLLPQMARHLVRDTYARHPPSSKDVSPPNSPRSPKP